MRAFLMTTSAAALAATSALAGGVDRSGQSTNVLFEKGRHLEFSLGSISPKVSGYWDYSAAGYPSSGDILPAYTLSSAAYKADINDNLAYALIIDQPFGADVNYPTDTIYYAAGANATMRSTAVTALIKHTNDQHISVFGGVRLQSMEADIMVPTGDGPYTAVGGKKWKTGFVVGAAWERPDIAARVAVTYSSEITYELPTTENGSPSLDTQIKTPKSVNLAFQTGIAKDTLLFGNVRWVPWSGWAVTPYGWGLANDGQPIVSFSNDRTTYLLGVGRKLNETWAIAGTAGYEKTAGGISSNLAPTDGMRSVGLGVTRTEGNTKITAGVSYIWIGHAETNGPVTAGPGPSHGYWNDNTGLALAIKVAFTL